MWETRDPRGRHVHLTFGRWRHIVERHPELAAARAAVLASVHAPAAHRRGHEPGEEWFYGHGFGPGSFVRVVVHFDGDVGSITTAFPRRRMP